MNQHVVIAGNIGVGKSSLVQRMYERLGWEPFFEAVGENPYLADFYADMPRWAFHSQVFFLTRRIATQTALQTHPGTVIQDRCMYEDAEIFARNLFLQQKLHPRDYDTYRDLYEAIKHIVPPPNLIVYLQASVETLLHRIRLRGREYEQAIEPNYLAQLNGLYESWISDFTLSPVLVVPADRLDFIARPDDLELILEKIQQKLRGDQYVLFE